MFFAIDLMVVARAFLRHRRHWRLRTRRQLRVDHEEQLDYARFLSCSRLVLITFRRACESPAQSFEVVADELPSTSSDSESSERTSETSPLRSVRTITLTMSTDQKMCKIIKKKSSSSKTRGA